MAFLKKKIDSDHIEFIDNTPEAIEVRELQKLANKTPEMLELKNLQKSANNSLEASETRALKQAAKNTVQALEDREMQAAANKVTLPPPKTSVKKKVKGFFKKFWK